MIWVFAAVGMQSFGGGQVVWMRRKVVVQRRWLSEQQFLGGLALSQITPGPNGVNMAIFIGTTLRGAPGAFAALAGAMVLPMVLVLALGAALIRFRGISGVDSAMTGLGIVAIGLNAANGFQLCGRAVRRPGPLAVILVTAFAVGVLGVPFLLVMLVMVPVSLLLAGHQ